MHVLHVLSDFLTSKTGGDEKGLWLGLKPLAPTDPWLCFLSHFSDNEDTYRAWLRLKEHLPWGQFDGHNISREPGPQAFQILSKNY